MPELPDVETFRRYLNSTALHKKIAGTHVLDERILGETSRNSLGRFLKGEELEETTRHGKFLFAKAGSRGWLVLHFGMTGELKYQKTSKEEVEYARFTVDFTDDHRLIYSCRRMLGKVDFTDNLKDFAEKQELGPDALDDKVNLEWFSKTLSERNSTLKSFLMNQSIIAGIGNVYSDEIFFRAELHPGIKTSKLKKGDVERLYNCMHEVLEKAIDVQADVERMPEDFLLPHREPEARCPNCGGKIKKETIAGRSSYFCPKCQKK